MGRRGLYEQGKINERFYVGDQWHGAQCGNERPLVRHNVIKRIGDYKMAVISSNPVTVNYSVEGVPNTVAIRDRAREERDRYAGEQRTPMDAMGLPPEEETAVTMSSLTDYFKTTAERVKLDDLKEQALRNAYISGSGVLYTYWDDRIQTGLYADESGTTPITGDIACEVLDIENVYFGDPNLYELQEQPYILIAQRKSVKELRREARRNGRPVSDIEAIKPDRDTGHMAGDRSDDEPEETRKATVITKFWKEWDKDGACRILAAVVVKGATIRAKWDTKLRLYPLSVFRWERRRNCAYGESEITYLIPNQIAINRMITASVWAVLTLGMPITLVNKNMIPYATVTNDPGQILEVENIGTGESIGNALGYVNPPNFSPAFDNNITSLISNTLSQSGANDAMSGRTTRRRSSPSGKPPLCRCNRCKTGFIPLSRMWRGYGRTCGCRCTESGSSKSRMKTEYGIFLLTAKNTVICSYPLRLMWERPRCGARYRASRRWITCWHPRLSRRGNTWNGCQRVRCRT